MTHQSTHSTRPRMGYPTQVLEVEGLKKYQKAWKDTLKKSPKK